MWIRASTLLLALVSSVAWADNATLPPCPDSPNCVSSVAEDPDKRVTPLPGGDSPEAVLRHLTAVLDALPRVRFRVSDDGHRVYAVFETRWLGFKDDVDFLVRDNGTIEVRSASRMGYWDLGANRRRVERLRARLRQTLESAN